MAVRMEMDRDLVIKYVNYNEHIFKRSTCVKTLLLNLCVFLFSFVYYRSIPFIAVNLSVASADIIATILLSVRQNKFKRFLLFAIEIAFAFCALDFFAFSMVKQFAIFSDSVFILSILMQILVLIPCYFLNRYMLFRMNKFYKTKHELIGAITIFSSAVGVTIARYMLSSVSEETNISIIIMIINIIIYLISIVCVGLFYKACLIKKYGIKEINNTIT
jgi:hypothetical protein